MKRIEELKYLKDVPRLAKETTDWPELVKCIDRAKVTGLRHRCAQQPMDSALRPPTATSAPGLGSPLPHLRRDSARHCHICAGTGARLS
jgi:hypothetical protein